MLRTPCTDTAPPPDEQHACSVVRVDLRSGTQFLLVQAQAVSSLHLDPELCSKQVADHIPIMVLNQFVSSLQTIAVCRHAAKKVSLKDITVPRSVNVNVMMTLHVANVVYASCINSFLSLQAAGATHSLKHPSADVRQCKDWP